ncbi:hypothetical protein P154DRAFT_413222, partial [Amniculicola lignicola CBS 123094]
LAILPPSVGVFLIAGCGVDLLVNMCLTCLGYFPGHIHAFYSEYVCSKRRGWVCVGGYEFNPALGVYLGGVLDGG